MLPLDDPLWRKLDDAHRDRPIPKLLAALAETWDDETANSLFWDCLCHQETCYGATYAVIPHLLKIAQPDENQHQRLEIAHFLGFVVLCAFDPRPPSSGHLQGLPETLEAWDRKLDVYRELLANLERAKGFTSHYEQAVLLPRYTAILAVGPVNARDLTKIELIRADFFSALPAIRAICERALLENVENAEEHGGARYLLSGVAAADGFWNLARLLNFGPQGDFKCTFCQRKYEYSRFGDRIAI
jgi:hypothetical protein